MSQGSVESIVSELNKPKKSSQKNARGEPRTDSYAFLKKISLSSHFNLVVEGDSDYKFYKSWCMKNGIDVQVTVIDKIRLRELEHEELGRGSRRTQVISLSFKVSREPLQNRELLENKILCVADFDLGSDIEIFESECLAFTDFPSLESYTLTHFVMGNVFLGKNLCDLLDEIYQKLYILYRIRCYKSIKKEKQSFKNLRKAQRKISKEEINEYQRQFTAVAGTDLREYCYGHDVSRLIIADYGKFLQVEFDGPEALEEKLLDITLNDPDLHNLKLFRKITEKSISFRPSGLSRKFDKGTLGIEDIINKAVSEGYS
ncbi:hypothetical protein [Rothia sp. CCM 9416]|uniref:hypothetical protein n=1 Tax=Rothia sp. CCM 9416 TaxID=3402655 RepID=UPI003ADA9601